MKKRQKNTDEIELIIRSLKKLRASYEDEKLNVAAHKLLSIQLQAIKESTRAPNKGIISFDSRFLPLPEGVRPAAVETARLKYQIEDKQLQVSLYPVSSERFEIIGHLSGVTAGKTLRVVLKRGKRQTVSKSNEFQIFRFEHIQKNSYELEIYDGNESIGKIDLAL